MEFSVEKPLRKYEAVIILHPDVTEAEQKKFFQRNQETIQQYGGKVNHIDTWGKRRLANPIKKIRLATYFHTTFDSQGECISELERIMKIDERVLRYVHVRLDDRKSLTQHVDEFHTVLADSHKREQEKEMKNQARRMAMGHGGGSRGPRESNYGAKRSAPHQETDENSSEES